MIIRKEKKRKIYYYLLTLTNSWILSFVKMKILFHFSRNEMLEGLIITAQSFIVIRPFIHRLIYKTAFIILALQLKCPRLRNIPCLAQKQRASLKDLEIKLNTCSFFCIMPCFFDCDQTEKQNLVLLLVVASFSSEMRFMFS